MSVPQQSPPVLGLAVDPKRALNLLGHADDSILHAKDCRARRCQTVMGPEWSLGQLPEQRLTLVRLSETAAHRGHQRRRRGLTARLLILQGAAERRPVAGKGSGSSGRHGNRPPAAARKTTPPATLTISAAHVASDGRYVPGGGRYLKHSPPGRCPKHRPPPLGRRPSSAAGRRERRRGQGVPRFRLHPLEHLGASTSCV